VLNADRADAAARCSVEFANARRSSAITSGSGLAQVRLTMTTHRHLLCFLIVLLAAGCAASNPPALPPPPRMDDIPDAGPAEDAAVPEDPAVTGVEVSHDREIRGAWIATVFNINWPSRSNLRAEEQQRELDALFDAAVESGLNTIFLQVRGEADALYRSPLEPFSRFLTGSQNGDPGYDPLEYAVEAAHARGLEIHAWMNPYRAYASTTTTGTAPNHVTNTRPDFVVKYGDNYWIDPGSASGRAHTLAVIRDVLERYDVDGLHFDDYFYPYPEEDLAFPDQATYDAYRSTGGRMNRADFRRDSVHQLVQSVHALVEELRPDVRFGIAPFGIYRPGMPEGITGLDAYAKIFCDPLRWMDEGWVDYIAPQLYWPTTQTAQAYEPLLDWWADRAFEAGVDLVPGNFASRLGETEAWTRRELRTQIELTRAARDRGARGNIFFHIGPIAEDRMEVRRMLLNRFYGRPAASPVMPGATGRPAPPSVWIDDAIVTASALDERTRYYAVYQDDELVRLVPAVTPTFELSRGDYLVSIIDRLGRESLGVEVFIDADILPPDPDPIPTGSSCEHSYGGLYGHLACSPAWQCCDGTWQRREGGGCGACACEEGSGELGCVR